jgi:hypothetical protein
VPEGGGNGGHRIIQTGLHLDASSAPLERSNRSNDISDDRTNSQVELCDYIQQGQVEVSPAIRWGGAAPATLRYPLLTPTVLANNFAPSGSSSDCA